VAPLIGRSESILQVAGVPWDLGAGAGSQASDTPTHPAQAQVALKVYRAILTPYSPAAAQLGGDREIARRVSEPQRSADEEDAHR
jgi:hypothetical protein